MSSQEGKVAHFCRRALKSWRLYLLLLPAFAYVALFSYGPMYGLQIAFRDYRAIDGISGSKWVGLKHFARFIQYPEFWKMIKNTLSITLYSLATFPCAVIFALMLNEVRQVKFKKSVQMITYAPHFLSEVVVCSIILMILDRANGPVNNIIAALGGKRVAFISKPEYFPSIYVWSGVWQNLGWSSILYISALAGISPELIEAAKIDGANRMQVIWHVNIPGILALPWCWYDDLPKDLSVLKNIVQHGSAASGCTGITHSGKVPYLTYSKGSLYEEVKEQFPELFTSNVTYGDTTYVHVNA